MRAITDPQSKPSPAVDEKSPLIEKDVKFPAATFDNVAMTRDVTAGLDTSTDTETDMPLDNGFMDSCSSVSSKASDEMRREDDKGRTRQKQVSVHGPYMVHTWSIHGPYMVHTWGHTGH